jgi:nitrate reductase NapE component
VLRRRIFQLGAALVLLALVGLLAATGFGFLVWAFYQFCRTAMGIPGASFLTGLVICAFAGALLWTANKLVR